MQNDSAKFKIIAMVVLSAGILVMTYSFHASLAIGRNTEPITLNTSRHAAEPAGRQFYEDAFIFARQERTEGGVVGGIIPHHLLAADLIARFFAGLAGADYDTVILVGPNHHSTGKADIISSAFDWRTPYGDLECDREMLGGLRRVQPVAAEEDAIDPEHAITSEVAFIKRTFPGTKFLPLMLKPDIDAKSAAELGESLSLLAKDKKVLILASVDFSHYKDSRTAQADDLKSIGAIKSEDPAAVYLAALDSPASITTVMSFAKSAGASFKLKENSNSAILADKPDLKSTTSYVTGYYVK